MILPINTAQNPQNRIKLKENKNTAKNNAINFKAVKFLEIASKYEPIKYDLLAETKSFIKNGYNVSSLGKGLFAEVFSFDKFKNIVIKKPFRHDNFEQEAQALKALPSTLSKSQQFVARAYDDDTGNYYLLSTKVNGESPSEFWAPWNRTSLRGLFRGLFEMDKAGLYHGDLNNGNMKIDSNGDVNFLDFQWGTKTDKIRLFKNNTVQCMPNFIPIQNSQMFEMAEVPYYLKKLDNASKGKKFLNDYLTEKAKYHGQRVNHIYNITDNWEYTSEIPYINKAEKFESAQEEVYKNLNEKTLNLETLKIQFLSAFREASKYLDVNTLHKNIIPSGSSYLYALSSVQALRKKIGEFQEYAYGEMADYLEGMKDYADYWYNNLKSWTKDAFYYPYRHTRNMLENWETLHDFNDPQVDIEHFDSMTNVTKLVDKNFEVDYTRNFDCENRNIGYYMNEVERYINSTKNNSTAKTHYAYSGLIKAYERLKKAYNDEKWLDVINNSLLLIRRCEEMYAYGDCSSVQSNASGLAETVFKQVYKDVNDYGPGFYTFPGYKNMNEFS